MASDEDAEMLPARSVTRVWTVFGPSPEPSVQDFVAAYGSQADHVVPPSLENAILSRPLPVVSVAGTARSTEVEVVANAPPSIVTALTTGAVMSRTMLSWATMEMLPALSRTRAETVFVPSPEVSVHILVVA